MLFINSETRGCSRSGKDL